MRSENIFTSQSILSMKHIWKVLLFFIFILCDLKCEGHILPIGNIKDTIACVYSTNTDIYAVTRNVTQLKAGELTTDSVKIIKWNAPNWVTITQFVVIYKDWTDFSIDKKSWTRELAVYKDEIFLMGRYDSIVGLDGRRFRFLKWNGEKLEAINTVIPNYYQYTGLNNLTVFEDRLYVVTDSGKLFSYNGTVWTNVSDLFNSNDSTLKSVDNKAIYNGKMYLTGRVHKNGGADSTAPYLKLLSWNGIIWKIEHDSLNGELVTKNDNGILIADTKGGGFWNGQKMNYLNDEAFFYNPIVSFSYGYKDKLYLKDELNSDSLYRFWDGFNWLSVPYNGIKLPSKFIQDITFFQFKNELYAFGSFKDKDNNFFTIGKLIEPSKITGILYVDANNNCIKDSGEKPVTNAFVQIKPIDYYINTNDSGSYSIYLDSGLYSLKVISRKYFEQTCPANTDSTIVNAYLDSVHINNFAIEPIADVQDIRISLTGSTGWRARKGFTESYTLCYENVGTTTAKGTISLLLDSNFTNFSSTPTPLNFTYPVAEWEFDSLEIGQTRCITFKVRIDSAAINDSMQLVAAFDGGDSWIDSSYYDNMDTLKQRIVASLDPNDKTSYPEGNITKDTEELRYQIRFQNTGTDTAYRVTVIDTVDTNLPLTKVMMNSASHKYKLDIKNNVFKWTFEAIMLPDSTTNEELSHGFINYTAQIKPGLAIGTEIKNTAYIYFDYQKPVITNTARSKMVDETNIGIKTEKTTFGKTLNIYPNPAANKVYFKNTGITKKQLIVLNSLGQQIKTIALIPGEIESWDVITLPAGLYFIQTEGEATYKLVIQH